MKNGRRNSRRYEQMAQIIEAAGPEVSFCKAYALHRQRRVLPSIKNFPFTTSEWESLKRVVLAGKRRGAST